MANGEIQLTVSGTVSDIANDTLIPNSTIIIFQSGKELTRITNSDGNYSATVTVKKGEVQLTYLAEGYLSGIKSVPIDDNTTPLSRTRTIKLTKL